MEIGILSYNYIFNNSMRRYLFLLFTFIFSFQLNAQTQRPDVLVIGNSNAAVAAAIQAAQSNAKTILLLQSGGFDIEPLANDLHSGVQAKFVKKLRKFQKLNDSVSAVVFDKQAANKVLRQWTDSIKNLTVIKNTLWIKADRSGKNWVFKLSDGKTIRPEILVNIADQKLNAALKIELIPATSWSKLAYQNPVYKTSVGAGKFLDGSTNTVVSLYQLLLPNQENLVYVIDATSMLLGQSAGAIAAYAGYFDGKTSEANLKSVQGELISFNTNLMPFADVILEDPNWKAIQMVGLTGLFKAMTVNEKLLFNPDQLVTTEEIKQPMKDHYYKAQIWFDDYKNETITVDAALDMVCYVGNKAKEHTYSDVEKKWKTTYALSSTFNLTKQITRRELATLLQDYMPPFNVTIDKTGKIIR